MVDRYTKAMLTIIAFCLLYLCLQTTLAVPTAHAQNTVMDVRIVGYDLPIGVGGGLPVRIVN